MSDKLVTYEQDGEIAIIGLNRPEKRNAFNDAVREQLAEAAIRANLEARVAILFGNGPCFCAGLDLASLKERIGRGERLRSQVDNPGLGRGFDLMARGDIPFIAALHGAVIGGGLEIAASCHIRVADETTFFALPEGQRGIYVGGGGSVRIARLVSVARMTDMMLTGRAYSAEEAERYNIVQYVVDEGGALKKAKELAHAIASNSLNSNYAVINSLPRIADMSYNDGLYVESLTVASIYSDESEQRISDFLEHRAKRVAPPT